MYYLCCKNTVADHLIAQLLRSCFELFWHMQGRFPHDVAQMHHVQIRDLRVTLFISSPEPQAHKVSL